ncbi:leucine-rich repeat domain-containing protein [Porphyromonas uenonis]|uniref:InlB B-repeat-containing protein n=1 Tax=Porphyromonas uenonis TaxID=281920 RepID=UPI0026F0E713|nr:leucine-rich repeat domain-containing protein [Porphyromonas uenonis]
MSKQLRIWLFILLGTLLTSTSLLAEGVITMTTNRAFGGTIKLAIKANGYVSIDGVQESARTNGYSKDYTLTSQTITIRGDVTYLDCYNNSLTSLDLSGCIALTTLGCNINQLTSLDVSKNTALTVLNCSRNQLISLDISGCTSLTKLDCYDNQLTSLDLSKNHDLAMLDCSDNKLPSLNLSDHKALTTLECRKNLLRKINLSGCTRLLSLTCYNNQIKEREMTNLVNSLPDLGSKGTGTFRVFYDGSHYKDDGNVCLAVHVATAQTKGWKTQFTRDEYGYAWYDYSGADNPLYAVTSSSTGGGSISFTGADNLNAVPYGTTLTVVASPADGYKLTKLTANGQNILQTKRFKVTANTRVDATFTLQAYNVTTIKLGEGTLYVSGADDLDAVMPGTELTVTAIPAEGYELTKLTANDKSVLDTKKVVVNEDLIIRVIFSKQTFKVSLEPRGKGTIKAVGADDLNAVPYGTELTIVATPEEGSELASLIAGGINITETKKVTIKRETTIEAVFTTQSFAVKLTKEGEGTISATGADNLDAVDYGTELTIVATPAEGYELTALTSNGSDILATKKVVVTGNLTVKATFAKKVFSVSLTKEGEGRITATGASNLNAVAYGTELTIVATPAEGYELTALTANGTDILATKKIVVEGNLTVKATFTKKTFAVTLTSNEHGDITIVEPVNLEAVPYGTTLTVKATGNNAQCVLTELTANGRDILATQRFVVEGATEVKATFVDHTGVETTVTQQVQLYPNPATDYLLVEGVAPASEVTLHSLTGERLYAGRADSRGVLQIDLTPYADGVYLVCVAGETYRVVVRR